MAIKNERYSRERKRVLDKYNLCLDCKQPRDNHTKRCNICRTRKSIRAKIYRLQRKLRETTERRIVVFKPKPKVRRVVVVNHLQKCAGRGIFTFALLFCMLGFVISNFDL